MPKRKRAKKSSKKYLQKVENMTKKMSPKQVLALLSEQEDKILEKERLLKKEEDRILSMEHRIEKEERRILKEEEAILKEEQRIEEQERLLLEKEAQVHSITHEIEQEVTERPLKKLSMRDVYKAIVGAFFGVVAHFAFVEGAHVADHISFARATVILVVAYLLGILLIDKSGFKQVQEQRFLKIIPVRVSVIYLVSLSVIITIFLIFNQFHESLVDVYKGVAVTSILAMLGAASADMIGHE